MNQLKEAIIGILFPRRCPVCSKIVREKGNTICCGCRKKLHFLSEPLCKKCGKPLMNAEAEFCYDCEHHTHYFEVGRALFLYEKEVKRAVQQMKYYNKKEYADFFVEVMGDYLGKQILQWEPQVIIPIPMYWKKKQKRGFNQAELLGKGLSKAMGIPYRSDLLRKTKNTDSQKELSNQERKKNLKNAFKIMESDVKLEIVLLVDDVYTTGSTIDAAAKALLEYGAQKVYYVSICIGKGTF